VERGVVSEEKELPTPQPPPHPTPATEKKRKTEGRTSAWGYITGGRLLQKKRKKSVKEGRNHGEHLGSEAKKKSNAKKNPVCKRGGGKSGKDKRVTALEPGKREKRE